METMKKVMRKIDDVVLMTLGATAVALTVLTVSYVNVGEVNTVQAQAQPMVNTTEQCTAADIAHIPYPDEYEFYCVGNTMEIWEGEEYITSEIRGEPVMIQAEDGSFVPPSFYEASK